MRRFNWNLNHVYNNSNLFLTVWLEQNLLYTVTVLSNKSETSSSLHSPLSQLLLPYMFFLYWSDCSDQSHCQRSNMNWLKEHIWKWRNKSDLVCSQFFEKDLKDHIWATSPCNLNVQRDKKYLKKKKKVRGSNYCTWRCTMTTKRPETLWFWVPCILLVGVRVFY